MCFVSKHSGALLLRWPRVVYAALCLFMLWGAGISSYAQSLLTVPPLSARVIDQTGALGAGIAQLEAQLANIEQQRGSQVVVLMVASTQGEEIAAFAHRVADEWKIGRKEVGDGLLIVVATQDRRMRIEVARALEGAVPDLMAHRIIEEKLKPAFREGDYVTGLSQALTSIDALIAGEALPPPSHSYGSENSANEIFDNLLPLLFFAIFFVPAIASIVRRAIGRGLGSIATAGVGAGFAYLVSASLGIAALAGMVFFVIALFAGLLPATTGLTRSGRHHGGTWSGGWGAGGGSSGGFGGGFGSGGGGSFGGGGASGSW